MFILIWKVGDHDGIDKMNLTHTVWSPPKNSQHENGLLPTVFALHGHGANSQDLLGLAPYLASGQILLICPEAEFQIQQGLPSYTWFNTENANRRTSEEFERVTKLLVNFIADATNQYNVDSERTIVLGFSQGGGLAYELGLSMPEKFRGLAALSTSLPEETITTINNSTNKKLDKISIFIQHGISDEIVTVDRGRNAHNELEKIGLNPRYHEYDMQHQISAESLNELSTWISDLLL
ncbi:MAG: hypothetical protein CL792_03170 [Chloroflexi bacterium]|nr:hypothetical protein [Chloroflexota bacterium]